MRPIAFTPTARACLDPMHRARPPGYQLPVSPLRRLQMANDLLRRGRKVEPVAEAVEHGERGVAVAVDREIPPRS